MIEPAGLDGKEAVYSIYSDAAIIEEYWDSWESLGVLHNAKASLEKQVPLTHENCIQDWVSVNWASQLNPAAVENIIPAPNRRNFICQTSTRN